MVKNYAWITATASVSKVLNKAIPEKPAGVSKPGSVMGKTYRIILN